jgi:hypothetical protein
MEGRMVANSAMEVLAWGGENAERQKIKFGFETTQQVSMCTRH